MRLLSGSSAIPQTGRAGMFTLIAALRHCLSALRRLVLASRNYASRGAPCRALNETLAPHLKNKTAFHEDRQLPAQSYHAQISQFTKLAPLSLCLTHTHTHTHTEGQSYGVRINDTIQDIVLKEVTRQ